MKTAVAYYRISKSTGETERQKSDVENHCKVNDIEIIQTFEEKMSGAKKNRKMMTQMFQYFETHKVDYCVISELSRYGRTNEVLLLVDKLDELNICLVSLKEKLKTLDPDPNEQSKSRLILNIWTGLNNYELDTIRYRVKSGRDYAIINKGSWTGSNKYNIGYKTIPSYKSTNSKLVINEDERYLVELIFDKFNSGWGCVKICNYLDAQGIKTRTGKTQWARTSILQILKNRIYVGQRLYNDSYIDVPELRIISDNTFNTAQQRIKERTSTSPDFRKSKKYSYMLDSKIIRCGVCGKHFFGVHRYNVYKCITKKYSRGCDNTSILMSKTEVDLLLYLMEHWSDLLNNDTEQENMKIDLMLHMQEKERIQQRLARIKELYVDGDYNKSEYEEKTEKQKQALAKISETIQTIEKSTETNKVLKSAMSGTYMINGSTVPMESTISKETVHKIVSHITATKGVLEVTLANGHIFNLV